VPSSYSLNPGNRFGVISFWGAVDGKQVVAQTRKFFASDRWKPGFRVLWDARDITSLDITPDDVRQMKALIDEFRPRIGPGRSAVVTTSEDVATIAHLLAALAPRDPQRPVEVFDDLTDALRWLSVSEEPLARARSERL
jgi:hypothetical protein